MPFIAGAVPRMTGLALCWLLAGCASQALAPQIEEAPGDQPAGWWSARFQIVWPEDEEPLWHMDELLADRVIAPVLARYRHRIGLWRVHRRAARDNAGHRFSFVFYASPQTADALFRTIEADPVLEHLLAKKRVTHFEFDDPAQNHHPAVEDTSDAAWPPAVRKSWPKFIMGASEMWLELVHGMAESEHAAAPSNEEALYRKVHEKVTRLWKYDGQHPFLHHLNAVFGYEEMMVIDRSGKAMRF